MGIEQSGWSGVRVDDIIDALLSCCLSRFLFATSQSERAQGLCLDCAQGACCLTYERETEYIVTEVLFTIKGHSSRRRGTLEPDKCDLISGSVPLSHLWTPHVNEKIDAAIEANIQKNWLM